jgi:hypothetical protein
MPMRIINRASFVSRLSASVMFLTLSSGLCGCLLLERRYGETCNTRAYAWTDIEGFINQRFTPHSPVRMAIIPFVTPANLAQRDNELPGLGNQLAWSVQRELLSTEVFPVVELLNRQDWPGKKEEFFTGNFGAISYSRDAGYDLVLIGYLEPQSRLDTWTIHTKLIEVDSGITLWYGTSQVSTMRKDMLEVSSTLGLTNRRPDLLYTDALLGEAAACIARDMLKDPNAPR